MTLASRSLRTLLAGAALAAAGQAGAQGTAPPASSLTIYGVADACVVNYASASGARWQANGGGCFYGSRLGFRGTEDLGDGLRGLVDRVVVELAEHCRPPGRSQRRGLDASRAA